MSAPGNNAPRILILEADRKIGAQLLRFVVVGLLNTAIGLLAVLFAHRILQWDPYAANAFGYLVGLSCGFALNRAWTFRDTGPVSMTAMRYLAAFLLSYGANLAVLTALIAGLGVHHDLAQAAALLTYSLVFFGLSRIFVFLKASS